MAVVVFPATSYSVLKYNGASVERWRVVERERVQRLAEWTACRALIADVLFVCDRQGNAICLTVVISVIKIYYDAQGDLLEIQFAQSSGPRKGIGLTDQITLFYDEGLESLLGLTAVSYARLLALTTLPLTELLEAPEEIQQKVRRSLQTHLLTRFMRLREDTIELEDVRISELVHSENAR